MEDRHLSPAGGKKKSELVRYCPLDFTTLFSKYIKMILSLRFVFIFYYFFFYDTVIVQSAVASILSFIYLFIFVSPVEVLWTAAVNSYKHFPRSYEEK